MMNTGMRVHGTVIIGYGIRTDTTVSTMFGGIRGGGIGTGIVVGGVITSIGTSLVRDSMSSGMRMIAGGGDPVMDAGSGINFHMHTTSLGIRQGSMVSLCLINHPERLMFLIKRTR